MGRVVSFEDHALARLRDRLGLAETARADLLAFARGHSEAVATIHQAVLHTLLADSFETMLDIVVRDWPALLEVDLAVLALVVGDDGFLVGRDGISHLDPTIVDRSASLDCAVTRSVERGHALFGADAPGVRTEALVRVAAGEGLPRGLLLLGQCSAVDPGSIHGAQLLEFLGHFLAAMMQQWLTLPHPGPPMTGPIPPAP